MNIENSTLLVDGSIAFDEILNCINQARNSILINMLIWRDDTIGNRHGRWTKATVQTPDGETLEMPLFALYHPASVIYNRSLKDTYDADLIRLASTLSARTDNESDI